MTDVRKLSILLCGFEIIGKNVSTRDRGERFIISVPISAYLLETTRGYILVDCGINSSIINDPELCRTHFIESGWTPPPVVREEHELLGQLKAMGIKPEEIRHVILTHMHADHTGNLKRFQHARVSVQRLEHTHAFAAETPKAYFPLDYDLPGLQWDLLEGDTDVMPGLRVLSTRGHTPGHCSLEVTLSESGTMIIVGDVGDLQENFDNEILPGESVDDAAALASIRRLKALAQERNATLLIGHDPDLVQRLKLAPEGYS